MKNAVTTAPDGSWLLWNLESGQVRTPQGWFGHALAGAWSSDGRAFVILDQNGAASLIDPATAIVRTVSQAAGPVALYSFSPDRRRLSYTTSSGLVVTLDLATAESQAFQAQGKVIAIVSTAQHTLVAAQLGGKVVIWSIAAKGKLAPVAERNTIGASLLAADISSNGNRLLAAGYFGPKQGLIAMNSANGKAFILSADALAIAGAKIVSVALDASGERAAILASDGRLWVWFIDGNDQAPAGRVPEATSITFSVDGAHIIVSGASGASVFTAPE